MGTPANTTPVHRTIDAVWRIESAKIIATVARMVRDVGVAEELAQDALITALEQWPEKGVPDNAAAWLTTTAKRRALDWLRRQQMLERNHEQLGHEMELRQEMSEPSVEEALINAVDDDIGDDLLRLVFTACHPLLSTEAQVALMELQASRAHARVGPGGEPVLLNDQNRARWDHVLIRRGLAALQRAESLAHVDTRAEADGALGPYALQAAIAACHARAREPAETDWGRITALYGALAQLTPSPVIELNRAVAVSMAQGPAAALPLIDRLAAEPTLRAYHLLPSVRGDLLFKLGRHAEARAEFERAASLTRNLRERELLLGRAAACASAG